MVAAEISTCSDRRKSDVNVAEGCNNVKGKKLMSGWADIDGPGVLSPAQKKKESWNFGSSFVRQASFQALWAAS